jgi:hypothetical protein
MSRANVAGVRRAAVTLKRDALPFYTRAGAVGNQTRALAFVAPPGVVRTYLDLITRALTRMWVEGVALSHLAGLAWSDPMLVVGGDGARLQADSSWARNASLAAERLTGAAWKLRWKEPAAFRYNPVGASTAYG